MPSTLGRLLVTGIAMVGSALIGTGCAFTGMPLPLPTEGLSSPIPGGSGRQIIVVNPFSEARAEPGRCGMKKNGYNMDTADAVCQGDPSAWIATLLANELRASGFQVLEDGEAHRPGAVRVEGSLIQIFVEPVIGAWSGSLEADLSVRLVASSETGLDAERTFFVKGWKGGVVLGTAQPYQTALHRATQATLRELVQAILELVDRYPELGAIDAPRIVLASTEARR